MDPEAAIKAELVKLELEHAKWEATYAEAERVMSEMLAPYNCHQRRIHDLKQALRVLDRQGPSL